MVVSVVRSILDEAGGRMDILGEGRRRGYRLCLPALPMAGKNLSLGILSEEQARQVSSWRVLLASARPAGPADWTRGLRDIGIQVQIADDIVTALHSVEAPGEIHVLVLDRQLLGEAASALLRAIRKLRPRSGLVVLDDEASAWDESLCIEAIREADPSAGDILKAMVRSVDRLKPD